MDSLSITTADPEIACAAAEHVAIADAEERLSVLRVGLIDSNPDAAIAIWERVQAWIRGTERTARAGPPPPAAGMHAGASPLTSACTSDAKRLGEWRAAMTCLVLYRLARTTEGTSSGVLRQATALLRAHDLALGQRTRQLARGLIESWRERTGQSFEVDTVLVEIRPTQLSLRAVIRRPA